MRSKPNMPIGKGWKKLETEKGKVQQFPGGGSTYILYYFDPPAKINHFPPCFADSDGVTQVCIWNPNPEAIPNPKLRSTYATGKKA